MVHLAPGDPIAAVMPAESSKAEIEAVKRAYGFDKPLPVQYLVWLGRVAQGDLGKSIATRRPVILDVRDALATASCWPCRPPCSRSCSASGWDSSPPSGR